MVQKEKRQDSDGVLVTAYNGITQSAMPTIDDVIFAWLKTTT